MLSFNTPYGSGLLEKKTYGFKKNNKIRIKEIKLDYHFSLQNVIKSSI